MREVSPHSWELASSIGKLVGSNLGQNRGKESWMTAQGRRKPRPSSRNLAITRSIREIAGKYAACGWTVVQMDQDGHLEPRYGSGAKMPICLDVQRTDDRAEICALSMAL